MREGGEGGDREVPWGMLVSLQIASADSYDYQHEIWGMPPTP